MVLAPTRTVALPPPSTHVKPFTRRVEPTGAMMTSVVLEPLSVSVNTPVDGT
jgi:hypothetical protein